MALTIEDEAVHRDARRVAALTGQSITAVVRDAIADKLLEAERAPQTMTDGDRAATIMAAARAVNAALGSGAHSADHAELYGDDGLPA